MKKNRSVALATLRNLILTVGIDPPLVELMKVFSQAPTAIPYKAVPGILFMTGNRMNILSVGSHRIGDWSIWSIIELHTLYSFFKKSENEFALCHDLRTLSLKTRDISSLVVPAGSGSNLSIPSRSRLSRNGKNAKIRLMSDMVKISGWKKFVTW